MASGYEEHERKIFFFLGEGRKSFFRDDKPDIAHLLVPVPVRPY